MAAGRGLSALLAAWAAVSLAEVAPLAGELGTEELDGWQIALAAAGVVLYAAAAVGYYRLYRRRQGRFLLVVALAFALLAEAMLVIVWARNWRVSWWEWHLLMLVAFAAIAVAARTEWHEERFSPLYLDETLADTREVSVLFADLQGFTSFSERTSAARVAAMLNGYYGRLVPLLEADGGVVHQIIGDAVMVSSTSTATCRTTRSARRGRRWPSRLRPPGSPTATPSGRASAPASTAARCWPASSARRAATASTASSATPSTWRRGWSRSRRWAESSSAPRPRPRSPPGALLERLPPLQVKGKEEPIEAYLLRGL